ncbi:MAG: hypothetical protein KAS32_30070 [Candidatus Peribacteraceae bacterium]|nr:hypothetical protein [Candidatus Peribacteraceae bacterium]
MYIIGILTDSGYLYGDVKIAAERAGFEPLGPNAFIKDDNKIIIDHVCHIPKVFTGKEINQCVIYTFEPIEHHSQLYQSSINIIGEFVHVNPYGAGLEPILKLEEIFSKRGNQ